MKNSLQYIPALMKKMNYTPHMPNGDAEKILTATIKPDGETAVSTFRCSTGKHKVTLTITKDQGSIRIVEKGPCTEKILGMKKRPQKRLSPVYSIKYPGINLQKRDYGCL